MNFGFFGTAGIKAGLGRVVGARFGGAEKANRSTRVTVDRLDAVDGIGGEWASAKYGDYYATSSAVYAAVRTRPGGFCSPLATLDRPAERFMESS